MDFLKILRSLEEFLYEVMTWLLFYPRTLWRVIRNPGKAANYASHELRDKEEDQFVDAISPPLFLMLSVLLAHFIEIASHSTMFTPAGGVFQAIFASEQNLLLYRSVMYSIWALLGATTMMHIQKEAIDRRSLRPAFFTQCYLAAPFAIAFSTGSAVSRGGIDHAVLIGNGVMLAAILWYMAVQMIWFHETLKCSWLRAALLGLWVAVGGLVINMILLLLMTGR